MSAVMRRAWTLGKGLPVLTESPEQLPRTICQSSCAAVTIICLLTKGCPWRIKCRSESIGLTRVCIPNSEGREIPASPVTQTRLALPLFSLVFDTTKDEHGHRQYFCVFLECASLLDKEQRVAFAKSSTEELMPEHSPESTQIV